MNVCSDRGWDGWMASPTQWIWIWVNSRSWWWTGRPGVLQSMGSQRVGHDWPNWTEQIKYMFTDWNICFQQHSKVRESTIKVPGIWSQTDPHLEPSSITVWSWESCWTSLSFAFLICNGKMGYNSGLCIHCRFYMSCIKFPAHGVLNQGQEFSRLSLRDVLLVDVQRETTGL